MKTINVLVHDLQSMQKLNSTLTESGIATDYSLDDDGEHICIALNDQTTLVLSQH